MERQETLFVFVAESCTYVSVMISSWVHLPRLTTHLLVATNEAPVNILRSWYCTFPPTHPHMTLHISAQQSSPHTTLACRKSQCQIVRLKQCKHMGECWLWQKKRACCAEEEKCWFIHIEGNLVKSGNGIWSKHSLYRICFAFPSLY